MFTKLIPFFLNTYEINGLRNNILYLTLDLQYNYYIIRYNFKRFCYKYIIKNTLVEIGLLQYPLVFLNKLHY